MHLHGWGVKADPTKAYQYFQNAKKAGHIGATYQFARMHDIGIAPVRRSSGSATFHAAHFLFQIAIIVRDAAVVA